MVSCKAEGCKTRQKQQHTSYNSSRKWFVFYPLCENHSKVSENTEWITDENNCYNFHLIYGGKESHLLRGRDYSIWHSPLDFSSSDNNTENVHTFFREKTIHWSEKRFFFFVKRDVFFLILLENFPVNFQIKQTVQCMFYLF